MDVLLALAVRQNEAILSGGARKVKESANGHIPD
jgi:hypothetical protein